MNHLISLLVVLLLFAAPDFVAAQPLRSETPVKTGTTAATSTAAADTVPATFDQQRFDKLRTEGFAALYSLEYEVARRHFKEMARLFPDHPGGTQFLAAALWLKTLNESRRLQASLYNTEAFYAKTAEKTDPKIVAEFRELTRQSKLLSQARLKRNPKDVEALYYLGATEGLKAAFAGAVERSFRSALSDGSEAVDRHRDVIKLDPDYHDAEISIGMYDYVVSTLPLPVKLMAAVGGIRGSKKRGLETLSRVAREGKWAKDDAKVLLIALLKRERKFDEAYAYAKELGDKYPRNYVFKLEAADALVAQANIERQTNPAAAVNTERQAFAIFDTLLQRDRNAPARPLDMIHYSYGEALFTAGQMEPASKEFVAAATVAGAEAGLATMARLRAGQSFDLAGKRDEAITQYKIVLTRPNIYTSHEEAQRGLREPYKRAPKVVPPDAPVKDDNTDAPKP